MKNKLLYYLCVSILMTACTDIDIVNQHENGSKSIIAKISENLSGRTCIGSSDSDKTTILWNSGDLIGVYGTSSKNIYFTNKTDKVAEATFTGNMSDTPLYAYYPYSNDNSGVAYTSVKGDLPLTQTFDMASGRLQADFKIGIPDETEEGVFLFKHVFSLLKFEINADDTDLDGDNLESISLLLPEGRRLGGSFTINISSGKVSWDNASTEGCNEITMEFTDQPALTAGTTYTGFITCAPEGIKKGDEITIVIRTNKHRASFKRNANMGFEANAVYTVPLTLKDFKDDMTVVEEEKPVITSFSFEVADNANKILGTELYYNGVSTATRSVTEESLNIDNEKLEITGCIPYLYDFSLVPTFTTSENAIVTVNGVVQESGVTEVDFSNPVEYVVSIGENKQTYTVSVSNTGLPIVVLSSGGSGTVEWEEAGLMVKSKEAEFGEDDKITVYNADGSQDLPTSVCGFRLRGNSTQGFPKKPFAIKLDNKANLLNIMPSGSHKRWVLLANWTERSLIRNAVAYKIANQTKVAWEENSSTIGTGLIWNPSAKNVELVIDGRHIGNYLLGEQIKIDKNRVNIQSSYENGTPDDVSTYGYLLEFDTNLDEVLQFRTPNRNLPYQLKDAEEANQTISSHVSNRVDEVENYLSNGDYTAAYDLLDINSVIDWWIVQEIAMNNEYRQPKSTYMYMDGNGKLCAGPVWDFDYQTFPNIENINTIHAEKRNAGYSAALEYHSAINEWLYRQTTTSYPKYGTYMWYPLLFGDETFKKRVQERWEVIKPYLESIPAFIREMGEKNKLSDDYNAAMWPIESQQRIGYGWFLRYSGDERLSTYQEVIENLVTCYNDRLNAMNSLITNGKFIDNSGDKPVTPN